MRHFTPRAGIRLGLFGLIVGLIVAPSATAQQFQQTRTVPNPNYFLTIERVFDRGEYRDAHRQFQREWRGAIKSPQSRWIDSICYHTMMGECEYHMGNLPEALDQYNAALDLYLAFPNWMLSVQFPQTVRAANVGQIRRIPWGTRTRDSAIGIYPDTISVAQGRIDNAAVVQQGGIVQQAVNYPVVVQEVVRCTLISLRRRRELMGAASPYDSKSHELVSKMAGAVAPPNHWSQAWADVQLGIAYTLIGKEQQARDRLARGLLAAGQFDHPFTSTALFELGRQEMMLGKYDAAINLFQEASYSAFQYPDGGLLEECFRLGAMAHVLANKQGLYPPLSNAFAWARRENLDHLEASISLLIAEQAIEAGNAASAASTLQGARTSIARRDMAQGAIGGRFDFLSALANYQQGKISEGDANLQSAMTYLRRGSLWLWHIRLADTIFTTGQLSPRDAFELYGKVLRDPTANDWRSSPMEALAMLNTEHEAALEHWFLVALERNEKEAAIEIADLVRRHRFYNSLLMGGRLLALRWVLEAPEQTLTKEALLQRQDLNADFPGYVALGKEAAAIRNQLEQLPAWTTDSDERAKQKLLLAQLSGTYLKQEAILREMALRRQPCEMAFPPKMLIKDIQKRLGERRLALLYMQTDQSLYGFFLTSNSFDIWEIPNPRNIYSNITKLMTEFGNRDGNRPVDAAQLQKEDWLPIARELYAKLMPPARSLSGEFDEMVIVPDGPLWYLPFELLDTSKAGRADPLIGRVRIRYAPTAGLMVPDERGRSRFPTTAVAAGRIFPQEPEGMTADAVEDLTEALPAAVPLQGEPLPGQADLYASLFDRLVVYDDLNSRSPSPYGVALIQSELGKPGGDLGSWLTLPWGKPDQVILPGFHTPAEHGMQRVNVQQAGRDVFLTTMAMMASGTRTILLSRWRTGGQIGFDLVKEFAGELEFSSAAEAWQRSVLLNSESRVSPETEPRVQFSRTDRPFQGNHPFFWSGYMLIDTGTGPKRDVEQQVDPLTQRAREKQRLLEEARKKAMGD